MLTLRLKPVSHVPKLRVAPRLFSSSTPKWRSVELVAAPRALIDVKSIRLNPDLHVRNCLNRNYIDLKDYPQNIIESHTRWLESEKNLVQSRVELKKIRSDISKAQGKERDRLIATAQTFNDGMGERTAVQKALESEIDRLSQELPNLMSDETPVGDEPRVLEVHEPTYKGNDQLQDHVRIGAHLDILNFAAASPVSGSGFYYLLNDGEMLEQALIQYARTVARRHGFAPCSPPSLVYSDIGTACGFRPRDQNGEQQVYTIQQGPKPEDTRKPSHCLAGTAEIPFAGLHANTVLECSTLPKRIVGSSRCYRAEAGAHGRRGKGLYRVHEFTKVEMFAWTLPGQEEDVFHAMMAVQKEIIQSLGLPYRVLEMPSHDLGASAFRKQDIEVFFPSRKDIDDGWGEVTSTSICTDYQTRRLNTKIRMPPGSPLSVAFASTVNGTAMAVPRILAAILENGWVSDDEVRIPEALWPYLDGQKIIGKQT